ncbi:hypothetical protein ACIP10_36680 [Streptomyces galbus]|uniref:hypothetical protein n=1 Tax=Streptomyces galbus TaxID=33898 RepID=UPI00382900F1
MNGTATTTVSEWPPATRDAPDWMLARIQYLHEAERFEQRLGHYLGGHQGANEQLGVLLRAVWERAVAAGRWRELGTDDTAVDGAVGRDRARLEAVVESGNLRERLSMLYTGGFLISDLLGRPLSDPPVISAERAFRPPSAEILALRRAAERLAGLPDADREAALSALRSPLVAPLKVSEIQPPLSEAERALMPGGSPQWISGRRYWDIRLVHPMAQRAEETGGLLVAGTSGTTYRTLGHALAAREIWGVDVDLQLVRLALLGALVSAQHHSMHEIMAAGKLFQDEHAGRVDGLDYTDNWGRYWNIGPLTEEELRRHVAVDGMFPDEHVLETVGRLGLDPRRGAGQTDTGVTFLPIRGEDGSLLGTASFPPADWSLRQDVYARLGGTGHYTSWQRDAEGRPVAVRTPLPGRGPRFFWASHGGGDGLRLAHEDGGTRTDRGDIAARRMAEAVASGGYGSVMVLACGPDGLPRSLARLHARDLARRVQSVVGVPTFVAWGEIAVAPADDGGPAADIHLLPDVEGLLTGFESAHPPNDTDEGVAEESVDDQVAHAGADPATTGRASRYPDSRYVNASPAEDGPSSPAPRTSPAGSAYERHLGKVLSTRGDVVASAVVVADVLYDVVQRAKLPPELVRERQAWTNAGSAAMAGLPEEWRAGAMSATWGNVQSVLSPEVRRAGFDVMTELVWKIVRNDEMFERLRHEQRGTERFLRALKSGFRTGHRSADADRSPAHRMLLLGKSLLTPWDDWGPKFLDVVTAWALTTGRDTLSGVAQAWNRVGPPIGTAPDVDARTAGKLHEWASRIFRVPLDPAIRPPEPALPANPWAVSSRQTPGAARAIRFEAFYRHPSWPELTAQFERDAADRYHAWPSTREAARDALRRLRTFIESTGDTGEAGHTPPSAAAVFPGPWDAALPAAEAARRFDALLADGDLDALMEAFQHAALVHLPMPLREHPDNPDGSEVGGTPAVTGPRHDARGFRHLAGPGNGPAPHLLRAYHALAPTPDGLRSFMRAVMAWTVRTGRNSMFEVYQAWNAVGGEAPTDVDASRMYRWAAEKESTQFQVWGPPHSAISPLEAPQQTLYSALTQSVGEVIGDDFVGQLLTGIKHFAAAEQSIARPSQAPGAQRTDLLNLPAAWTDERRERMEAWIARHGVTNLLHLALMPLAHVMALHLYTRPDYAPINSFIRTAALGRAISLRVQQRRLFTHVWESYTKWGGFTSTPATLRTNALFRQAIAELPEDPHDLDDLDDEAYEGLRNEFRLKMDGVVESYRDELVLHIDMAAEALESLPAERERTLWWGALAPGRFGDPVTDGPIYTRDTIHDPKFRSTTSNPFRALAFAEEPASTELQGGSPTQHSVVVRVGRATAGRDVSFLARHPAEAEFLYLPGSVFQVSRRTNETHYRLETIEATEAGSAVPGATADPVPVADEEPFTADPQWFVFGLAYERALGSLIEADPAVLDAVRRTVRVVHRHLAVHWSQSAVTAAFMPETIDRQATAEELALVRKTLLDEASPAGVVTLTGRLLHAVVGADNKHSLAALWNDVPGLKRVRKTYSSPRPRPRPHPAPLHARMVQAGRRPGAGEALQLAWMFDALGTLPGITPQMLLDLRRAVLAHETYTRGHSLAEVLAAAQFADVHADDEPSVESVPGTRLYLWARSALVPGGGAELLLPHHLIHQRRAARITPWTTGGIAHYAAVEYATGLPGAVTTAQDRDVLPWPEAADQLRRHSLVRDALLRQRLWPGLNAAHLPTLHLLGGPDNALIGGRTTAQELAADITARFTRSDGRASLPHLLARDQEMRALMRQADAVALDQPRRENLLAHLARQAGARAAALLDGDLHQETARHRFMAIEALTRLPAVDGPVYWTADAPGDPLNPGVLAPCTTSRAQAVDALASARPGTPQVLYEVRRSSARSIAAFGPLTGATAVFPQPPRLAVVSRSLIHDTESGLHYTHIELAETTDESVGARTEELTTQLPDPNADAFSAFCLDERWPRLSTAYEQRIGQVLASRTEAHETAGRLLASLAARYSSDTAEDAAAERGGFAARMRRIAALTAHLPGVPASREQSFLARAQDERALPVTGGTAHDVARIRHAHLTVSEGDMDPDGSTELVRTLVGWSLSEGQHSLHEVLRALTGLHPVDEEARTALLGNGADLYDWADRTLLPGSPHDRPTPPQRELFALVSRELSAHDDALGFAARLRRADADPAAGDAATASLAALRAWREREGRSPLAGLDDLTVAELHRLTGPHARLLGSPSAAELRRQARAMLEEQAADGWRDLPAVILADPAVNGHVSDARRFTEGGDRAAARQAVAALHGRVDALAGTLHRALAPHAAAAAAALRQLPQVGGRVWWAGQLPDTGPEDDGVTELVTVPAFHRTWQRRETALQRAADAPRQVSATRRAVFAVVHSSARDLSVFTADPGPGPAVYPERTQFEVIGRSTREDDLGPYTYVTLRERDRQDTHPLPYPPQRLTNAGAIRPGGPLPAVRTAIREIIDHRGEEIGRAHFTDRDWALRQETYPHLGSLAEYVEWRRGPGLFHRRLPLPATRATGTYFYAAHGAPGGGVIDDLGVDDGTRAGQWLRERGEQLRFSSITVMRCYEPGREQPRQALPDDESLTFATRVAGLTQKEVFVWRGRGAVTGGTNGRPVEMHLLEDERGGPTGWVHARPGAAARLLDPSAEPGPATVSSPAGEDGRSPDAARPVEPWASARGQRWPLAPALARTAEDQAARRDSGPVYPDRALRNDPSDDGWQALAGGAVQPGGDLWSMISMRDLKGADGTFVGRAAFSGRGWAWRAGIYDGLGTVTEYVEWRRGPSGERLARRVALPETSGTGTFFFAAHGAPGGGAMLNTAVDDGRWAAGTLEDVPARGHRSITLLIGQDGTPQSSDAMAAFAGRIADATGLPVLYPRAGLAATMSDELTDVHLLEDREGRPTGWVTVRPGTPWTHGQPATDMSQAALDEPVDRPLAVRGWQPPGAAEAVRFASFYRDPEWRGASLRYELALGTRWDNDPAVRKAALDALSALHLFHVRRMGREPARALLNEATNQPFEQWSATASTRMLVSMFGHLALGRAAVPLWTVNPGAFSADASTWAQPATPDLNRRSQLHDPAGLRVAGAVDGPAMWLLQAYRMLGASDEALLAWRPAVVAWSIFHDVNSLAEVLLASHRLGLGDEEERAALRDGSRLHRWTSETVLPDVVPPHHGLYETRTEHIADGHWTHDYTAYSSAYTTPAEIHSDLVTVLAGSGTPSIDRHKAIMKWLKAYGDAPAAARRLRLGHLTAIFLFTVDGDTELFRRYVNSSRFGTAVRDMLMRHLVLDQLRRVEDPHADTAETHVAAQIVSAAIQRFDSFDKVVTLIRESTGETPGQMASALIRKIARDIARSVTSDLELHVSMLAEALDILPPIFQPVSWGGWLPGPARTPWTETLLTPDSLYRPRFQSTSERKEEAEGYVPDISFTTRSKYPLPLRHPILASVKKSSGREIAPFSNSMDEQEVLYEPRAFRLLSRTPHTGPGRPRINYRLEELPSYPDVRLHNASGDGTWAFPGGAVQPGGDPESLVSARDIVGPDGVLVGRAVFSERGWAWRKDAYAGLGEVMHYVEWRRGASDERLARWAALPETSGTGTFFFAAHGTPDGGAHLDGGVDDGTRTAEILQDVAALGHRSITLLKCLVLDSTSRPQEAAVAYAGRVADATGLPVLFPTGDIAGTANDAEEFWDTESEAGNSEDMSDAEDSEDTESEAGDSMDTTSDVTGSADTQDSAGSFPDMISDRGGLITLHLLEDPRGNATRWVRVEPGFAGRRWAFAAAERFLPSAGSGAGRPWAVPGWQPAGSAEAVRFASFYHDPRWMEASLRYELTLTGEMNTDRSVREAALAAYTALHQHLASQWGEDKANRILIPGTIRVSPDQLLAQANTVQLMTLFARAALQADGTAPLWRDRPDAFSPAATGYVPKLLDYKDYSRRHDPAGLRITGADGRPAVDGPAMWLLQAYRALGASDAQLLALRPAVVVWSVYHDLNSLAEVLLASHRLGLGDPDESIALRDASRLHRWAQRLVGPPGPVPPHQQMYEELTASLIEGRWKEASDVEAPLQVFDELRQILRSRPLEGEDITQRQDSLVHWLDEYGVEGRDAAASLGVGHVAALNLYTLSGDDALYRRFVNAGRFGARCRDWLVYHQIRALIKQVPSGEILNDFHLPVTVADAVRELYGEYDAFTNRLRTDGFLDQQEHSSNASDIVTVTPPRTQAVLRILSRRVTRALELHVDMAAEALDILPPLKMHTGWGGWLPGAPGTTPDSPLITEDSLIQPRFRSTTLSRDMALGYMDKVPRDGSRHQVLAEVKYSTAREVTPFSDLPGEFEVLYPPTVFQRVTTTRLNKSKRPGAHYTLTEQPAYPDERMRNTMGQVAPPRERYASPVFNATAASAGLFDGEPVHLGRPEKGPAGFLAGLLEAVRATVPTASALADVADTAPAFERWLADRLKDEDVHDGILSALPDDSKFGTRALNDAGITLTPATWVQAQLTGGELSARELGLSRAAVFRLMLRQPSLLRSVAPEHIEQALATVAARELNVAIALARLGADGLRVAGETADTIRLSHRIRLVRLTGEDDVLIYRPVISDASESRR